MIFVHFQGKPFSFTGIQVYSPTTNAREAGKEVEWFYEDFYTWTSPDGQYRNQINYILCSQRWRSSIQSAKTRPGADCGTDHKLLIAKFRVKQKKVGKTTRPFRYDLNQIPYNHTVEVRKRFKGLDLINRVPKELWMEVRDIIQKAIIKKNKCKK